MSMMACRQASRPALWHPTEEGPMEESSVGQQSAKPLWRRIADFPLMAMLIAVGLFVLANAATLLVAKALPPMDLPVQTVVRAALIIAITLIVYKLAIRHLGEQPREDLRLADAPKGLGIGLALGAVVFAAIVGVAAIADVYNIVGEGGTGDLLR